MSMILLVCSANVCRSPLAAGVIRRELAADGELRVESAGIRARVGDHMCAESARALDDADVASSHKARVLTVQMLDTADLIITAESAQRSDIARMKPSVRIKTFTLVEAHSLAQAVSDGVRSGVEVAAVSDIARELNAARGLALPPQANLISRLFNRESDPFTIPDGHVLGDRAHKRTLESTASTAELFGRWVATQLR